MMDEKYAKQLLISAISWAEYDEHCQRIRQEGLDLTAIKQALKKDGIKTIDG